ncbi:MAG: hypothetical protein Q9N02_02860 [Ghiorsea sp.]|nr:hypothetical protein [Ghiorsea sp.]
MMKKLMLGLTVVCMGMTTAQAAPTHVHFAAFFHTGSEASISFPNTVVGDDIEGPMVKNGSEMMLFAHSISIQDGDVLSLQNDTLREVGGSFKDFGLNCQLTIHTSSQWNVSGMCETFFTGDEKNNQIVLPVSIPEHLIWYKVFEDKKQGVAGYFMKEQGKVFVK